MRRTRGGLASFRQLRLLQRYGVTDTNVTKQRAHAAIRGVLGTLFGDTVAASTRVIYGGSVKPSNAAEIFAVPNVDGALVGGASLKAADFGGVIAALEAA